MEEEGLKKGLGYFPVLSFLAVPHHGTHHTFKDRLDSGFLGIGDIGIIERRTRTRYCIFNKPNLGVHPHLSRQL